jgi:hypothetical protein
MLFYSFDVRERHTQEMSDGDGIWKRGALDTWIVYIRMMMTEGWYQSAQ